MRCRWRWGRKAHPLPVVGVHETCDTGNGCWMPRYQRRQRGVGGCGGRRGEWGLRLCGRRGLDLGAGCYGLGDFGDGFVDGDAVFLGAGAVAEGDRVRGDVVVAG